MSPGMSHLARLVAHCTWANQAWLRFVAESTPTEEWLRQRISHIFLGERAWFQRIAGEEPNRDLWTALDLPELERIAAAHDRQYAELFDRDLTRTIVFQRFTGEKGQLPVADILLHLTLHGAHHRGQMAARVSAAGVTPINTDFVHYCATLRT